MTPDWASGMRLRLEPLLAGPVAWRRGARLWSIWALASVTSAGVATWAGFELLRLQSEANELAAKPSASAASAPTSPVAAPSDFTVGRSVEPAAKSVLSSIHRSCSHADCNVQSATIQHHRASLERLARADIQVSLRGRYSAIKRALADPLARHPELTVSRLSLRTLDDGPSPTVEAVAQLVLWGAPLRADGTQTTSWTSAR
jgi:hypothetical protein